MISIILPIRNEENHISDVLESIINQNKINYDFEIIVVDGMSTDSTRDIVNEFINKYENVLLIDNPKKIVPVGFNLGLSKAKGSIIIRVDGHTIIDSDYIFNCVSKLNTIDAANVGGLMNANGEKFIDKIVAIATSSIFGVGNAYFHFSKIDRYVDTVFLGAWKKEIFEKYGGFDEELVRNQDDEFNFRLMQNGEKIWLDTSIRSKYFPRNSIKKLFKQYYQYGFYKIRLLQKRGGFSSIRHIIPGSFVFVLFISIILYVKNIKIFFIALLGTYTLVNIIFSINSIINYFFMNKKNSIYEIIASLIMLPIIYFVLHFSYGLGTLTGIAYFYNKWNSTAVSDSHYIKN